MLKKATFINAKISQLVAMCNGLHYLKNLTLALCVCFLYQPLANALCSFSPVGEVPLYANYPNGIVIDPSTAPGQPIPGSGIRLGTPYVGAACPAPGQINLWMAHTFMVASKYGNIYETNIPGIGIGVKSVWSGGEAWYHSTNNVQHLETGNWTNRYGQMRSGFFVWMAPSAQEHLPRVRLPMQKMTTMVLLTIFICKMPSLNRLPVLRIVKISRWY